MAWGMSVVAMGVASQEPLRLQVVYVGEQVMVARGHAGMEELVRDFLQFFALHVFWLGAKDLVHHSTLTAELHESEGDSNRQTEDVMQQSVVVYYKHLLLIGHCFLLQLFTEDAKIEILIAQPEPFTYE